MPFFFSRAKKKKKKKMVDLSKHLICIFATLELWWSRVYNDAHA